MARLVRPALLAILEAIEGIEAATKGKTFDDFGGNWLLRHGVQRGIEIISEPAAFRLKSWQASHRSHGRRSRESATCCGMNIIGSPTG